MFDLLIKKDFNDKLVINTYVVGTSQYGKPGTYNIVKIIK